VNESDQKRRSEAV